MITYLWWQVVLSSAGFFMLGWLAHQAYTAWRFRALKGKLAEHIDNLEQQAQRLKDKLS